MALIGNSTRIDIPGEPGQWLEIRGLDYLQRREARKVALANIASDLADYAEIQKYRAEKAEAADSDNADDDTEPTRDQVLAGFDWPTVTRYGLTAWSYDGELKPLELDEGTLKFAVASILAASGVAVPEDDTEGNSSAPSTGI